ncbi:MAG: glycerate kinase [Muribaculaceae bacterium]|nr:glycerate kinase [Muribaculaceae bacterium]
MKSSRKIVVACDSFKGSLTSIEAGEAVAEGVRGALPDCEVIVIPVGDGGEGTMEAITRANNGEIVCCDVTGPMGEMVTASYGIFGDTAVIEMAEASGLTLVSPEKRNPMRATTYGTGQLILDAIKRDCRNFLIGIGGSATNDGGTAMLRALGYRFLDADGNEITNNIADLGNLASIDDSNIIPELRKCSFTAACDVDTPLTGPKGATYVFGPQKGATPDMLPILDNALTRLAAVAEVSNLRNTLASNAVAKVSNLRSPLADIPGSGAGGGMGFALLAFLKASLKPGIDMVLDAIDFDRKIDGASLIITGEGRLDRQTIMGKTPFGILNRALKRGIPVIAIGGSVDTAALPLLKKAGFTEVLTATPADQPLSQAMLPATARANLKYAIITHLNPRP